MDIEKAPEYSRHNRDKIKKDMICGCYHCLTIFYGSIIENWVDDLETALCPICNTDSVLPGVEDINIFVDANKLWFAKDK